MTIFNEIKLFIGTLLFQSFLLPLIFPIGFLGCPFLGPLFVNYLAFYVT
uniref:Uncharacterized protein n=1 Tax=Lotus japonicus TaxID=34305 RepID=I3SPX4_LOTJA|nr:unknown [Lotus japonicus]